MASADDFKEFDALLRNSLPPDHSNGLLVFDQRRIINSGTLSYSDLEVEAARDTAFLKLDTVPTTLTAALRINKEDETAGETTTAKTVGRPSSASRYYCLLM